MIEETPGEDIIRAAAAEFTSHPRSWMGSAIPDLERRREEARAWAELGSQRVRDVAELALSYYEGAIESERLRESEDPFYA